MIIINLVVVVFFFKGEDKQCDYYPYNYSSSFSENSSTDSEGGGKAHNNMPPYITANCWRRTR